MYSTIEELTLEHPDEVLLQGFYQNHQYVAIQSEFACGYVVLPDDHPLCACGGSPSTCDIVDPGKFTFVTYLEREKWGGRYRWIAGFSSADRTLGASPEHSPDAEEMKERCHVFIKMLKDY